MGWLAAAVMVLAAGAAGTAAATPSAAEMSAARAVIKAADADRWSRMRRLSGRLSDPTLGKILRWMDYTRIGTDASFAEIKNFIVENPGWPMRDWLRRRAEEALSPAVADAVVLAWFREHPPLTADGMSRLGEALIATGEKEGGRALLRRAWIEGNFGVKQERAFYAGHRALLTRGDHVRRLDRLLWEGRDGPARRMLYKVDADYRALAEARLALRQMRGNIDTLIARVPAALRDDPGLAYERLRWRRIKGKDAGARELLAPPKAPLAYPGRWWNERAVLARRALRQGLISESYRIASEHGQTEGIDLAEAEWLAGWIALRFLGDTMVALDHFATLYVNVQYPVSRSRAAYWAGRAAEVAGDDTLSQSWYARATQHPTTYYGQLALHRVSPGAVLPLAPDPEPTADEAAAFNGHELTRAVKLLALLGEDDVLRQFLPALADAGTSAAWKRMAALLARDVGRLDLSIRIAKRSGQNGDDVGGAGYPELGTEILLKASPRPVVEMPLLFATIRQESAFQIDATSHAGARGLMQLMPGTAAKMAQRIGVPYSAGRLTQDPVLNLRLGQAYMAEMLEKYGGSHILALAAYNAGPSRVDEWIRINGDPRDAAVDAVDWIELIPFDETRNYVQRVIENVQVYRTRLTKEEVALSLRRDLGR